MDHFYRSISHLYRLIETETQCISFNILLVKYLFELKQRGLICAQWSLIQKVFIHFLKQGCLIDDLWYNLTVKEFGAYEILLLLLYISAEDLTFKFSNSQSVKIKLLLNLILQCDIRLL